MNPAGPQLLGQILDRHASALVLYARQWCDSPQDVVQDALVQLVRQPDLPERVLPWLYRVVRNGAISASRSAARRRRHERTLVELKPTWFLPESGTELDGEAAAAALTGLPLDLRETIVARLWGGLSFEEIAEVTATSSSTAHRRYLAALELLRERLGVTCPDKKK